MHVTIKTNIAALMADLDRVGREQVPYAMARTLTGLAYDSRDKVRNDLASRFIIRNNWVSKGIQVNSASKADWPMQQAAVGTRDDFMVRQEFGGKKEARNGLMGVPVEAREAVGSSSGELKPSVWPSRLVAKTKGTRRKFFMNTIKSGPNAGLRAIMRRDSDDRYPLQVIYLLKKSVDVKARWGFRDTVQNVVNQNYEKKLGYELSKAIASRLKK